MTFQIREDKEGFISSIFVFVNKINGLWLNRK